MIDFSFYTERILIRRFSNDYVLLFSMESLIDQVLLKKLPTIEKFGNNRI